MKEDKELIFLSTPITNALDVETGCLDKIIASQINIIASKIRQMGYDLFLAIEQEKWGEAIAAPEVCVPRDYRNLIKSKSLVVYLTECFSAGTFVEIGWASAKGIPVTIICSKELKLSPLLQGLDMIGDNRIYYVSFQDLQQIDMILKERL